MDNLRHFFKTRAPVLGPMRGLACLVAVSRLATPGANPEPRLGKIILLPAAPTDAASEAPWVLKTPRDRKVGRLAAGFGLCLRDFLPILVLDRPEES